MPTVTFHTPDGQLQTVEGKAGDSVMQTAIKNSVPGIDADCGGATCHVYVDEAWIGPTGTPGEMEASILDFAQDVRPNSRLSCQIALTADLDGLVVTVADSQH
jgi:2Fe-2S ferredoxin